MNQEETTEGYSIEFILANLATDVNKNKLTEEKTYYPTYADLEEINTIKEESPFKLNEEVKQVDFVFGHIKSRVSGGTLTDRFHYQEDSRTENRKTEEASQKVYASFSSYLSSI